MGGRGRGGFEVVRCGCVCGRNERLGEEGEVGGEDVHLAGERKKEEEKGKGEGVEVAERGKERTVDRSDELDGQSSGGLNFRRRSGARERESKFSFRK